MAPRRKRDKINKWLFGFFHPSKPEIYTPDGPLSQANSFKGIRNVVVDKAIRIRGDHNTVVRQDGQGDRNIETQIMSLLSQHIIRGAAHDSSARTPPPRCHPDTRVKLIARITAWFEGRGSQELLLWISGPAGVGKSAIVQTVTEHLAKFKPLGASVFFSRPNKRNNPHGVFITIAYQLATRIEAYRTFIVERLRLDPELLSGNMQAQFTTFIIEPFVEKNIGVGGKRWAILLDGLDELQGEDAQCNIIKLISTFTHEHPGAPLLWIIASRPESHISNTFDDDEIRRSYWSEVIPIDSTESCKDVERFLRSSFKMTQKKFRHSVPSDWPSNIDFLKLTAAASGLFVYAEVTMQFIRDPDQADPVSRLQVLLSVIDRSNAVPTKENPFVHLDALYNEILSSIPSTLWPPARQLLAFTIHGQNILEGLSVRVQNIQSLRGMSILFGIPRSVVYASVNKCRSTLLIPDWKIAHKKQLTLLHASLADYLRDSSRSGNFHVGSFEDVDADAQLRLCGIWNECSGYDIAVASIESMWHKYCSKWDDKTPSRDIAKFHANLFYDVVDGLVSVACRTMLYEPVESPIYAELRKVHMIKLCYCFNADNLLEFVRNLKIDSRELHDIGLLRKVKLRDLKFGHLDWKEMSPAHAYHRRRKHSMESDWIYRPRSSTELQAYVSELERLREHSPELNVVIFGGVPEGRVAAFLDEEFGHYTIPYPE